MHQFSHIHQKYIIWSAAVDDPKTLTAPEGYQKVTWIHQSKVLDHDDSVPISTAMKKVYTFYQKDVKATKSQPSIMNFVTKKQKC